MTCEPSAEEERATVSLLSDFEDRVSRAVEGLFAGVFRSPVQPAELARACAREMDRRKKLGVGKVYAPTLFSVLLSPDDGDQLGGFADTLAGELETYLIGHAQERSYELNTRPRVRFLVDEELKLGRFEIIGEILSADEIARELAEKPEALGTPVPQETVEPEPASPSATEEPDEPLTAPSFAEPGIATVTVPGIEHDIVLTGERMVVGRLVACDICLQDKNASRQHAAFEREGAGWAIVDQGSTNGTLVNGQLMESARLRDGDRITIGVSELIFHEPRG
jgi:hypothetical protein